MLGRWADRDPKALSALLVLALQVPALESEAQTFGSDTAVIQLLEHDLDHGAGLALTWKSRVAMLFEANGVVLTPAFERAT
jgi:hypothetical protein